MQNESTFRALISRASILDREDTLNQNGFRNEFNLPENGIQATANSLGPLTQRGEEILLEELRKFKTLGHDGHYEGTYPWWVFHENFKKYLPGLLGVEPNESAVMGTLSANIHFLMSTFIRIAREKYNEKVLVITTEEMFPSDMVASESSSWLVQGKSKGSIIRIPASMNGTYTEDAIVDVIVSKKEVCVVLLPIVCHKTGQRYDIASIVSKVKLSKNKVYFGLDLAHGIGNIPLSLSDWGIDFAAWCSYKYCSGGPGGVGGIYVRERYHQMIPPTAWWGLHKDTRFGDPKKYKPAPGVDRLMASNDPVFNSILFLGWCEVAHRYGLKNLYAKNIAIGGYVHSLVSATPGITVITPESPEKRGAQVSFAIDGMSEAKIRVFLSDFKKEHSILLESRGEVVRIGSGPYHTYHEMAQISGSLYEMLQRSK